MHYIDIFTQLCVYRQRCAQAHAQETKYDKANVKKNANF